MMICGVDDTVDWPHNKKVLGLNPSPTDFRSGNNMFSWWTLQHKVESGSDGGFFDVSIQFALSANLQKVLSHFSLYISRQCFWVKMKSFTLLTVWFSVDTGAAFAGPDNRTILEKLKILQSVKVWIWRLTLSPYRCGNRKILKTTLATAMCKKWSEPMHFWLIRGVNKIILPTRGLACELQHTTGVSCSLVCTHIRLC